MILSPNPPSTQALPPTKKNPKNKSNTLNGAINRIQNFFKMNAKE